MNQADLSLGLATRSSFLRRFSLCLPPPRLFAAVTLAFAVTSGLLIYAYGTNAPIWLANGIGVVTLLRQPRSTWWAYLSGFGLADAIMVASLGSGPAWLLPLTDVVEIGLAAWIIRFGGKQDLLSGRQLTRLLAACILAPVISSAAGAALLWWSESAPFLANWQTWYVASALGLLLVTPCLLCWTDARLRRDTVTTGSGLWLLGMALLLAMLALAVFSTDRPLLFVLYPALLLATWNRGLLGATTGGVLVGVIGMWATINGQGPIAEMVEPSTSTVHRVLALQFFVAATLLSVLPIAALIARLRHANETRRDFLAAMSHEIRTPLTGVLGMVDLLRTEDLSERQRGYVEAMRVSGRHLLNVVNDILDFSRIESGRLDLEEIDFPLPAVLEGLRSLVHPRAVERGVNLRIEVQPGMPEVFRGDPVRLKQVLLNLVDNAIKFTSAGSVTVRVSPTPRGRAETVQFEVADTGIGMQPEQMQRLFMPFTQADGSISRQYGGSGLGLAICKRLVEAMGGNIAAESTPGQGSVFRFHLPLHLGDALKLVDTAGASPLQCAPQRILIAEDVPLNREILRTALGRQGHELVFAENGAEALAQMERQHFDLVLMDVQMPVMDGVEATQRIRQLAPPRRFVPIIGLTANVMARERERYLAAGMDNCLSKPIDFDELAVTINKYCRAEDDRAAPQAPAGRPVVWIDEAQSGKLRRALAPEGLRELVATAIEAYEGYCRSIVAPDTDAQRRRQDAHKLRGSASTLGMSALADLAGRIENCAEDSQLAALNEQLQQALVRTRTELVERRLLPDPQHF